MHYVVTWSTGHQLAADWQRALAVQVAVQRARPGEQVGIERAEDHAAAAVQQRQQRRRRAA